VGGRGINVNVKGEVHPITCHKGTEGGKELQLYFFFNFGARWKWVVKATSRRLYRRESHGTHWMLGGYGKTRPHRDSIPEPSSPQLAAVPTEKSQITEKMYSSTHSQPRLSKEVSLQHHSPFVLHLRRYIDTHTTGHWSGPRAGLTF
jgi:hypothetical protein